MTTVSGASRRPTTDYTRLSSITATGASRLNIGAGICTNCVSAAGRPIIDGGMNTNIDGMRSMIGMTAIMMRTVIIGESDYKADDFTAYSFKRLFVSEAEITP